MRDFGLHQLCEDTTCAAERTGDQLVRKVLCSCHQPGGREVAKYTLPGANGI
jgi:hypothetical protein